MDSLLLKHQEGNHYQFSHATWQEGWPVYYGWQLPRRVEAEQAIQYWVFDIL